MKALSVRFIVGPGSAGYATSRDIKFEKIPVFLRFI
jgi:hypothetical protein